jgi:hypothetical protein
MIWRWNFILLPAANTLMETESVGDAYMRPSPLVEAGCAGIPSYPMDEVTHNDQETQPYNRGIQSSRSRLRRPTSWGEKQALSSNQASNNRYQPELPEKSITLQDMRHLYMTSVSKENEYRQAPHADTSPYETLFI